MLGAGTSRYALGLGAAGRGWLRADTLRGMRLDAATVPSAVPTRAAPARRVQIGKPLGAGALGHYAESGAGAHMEIVGRQIGSWLRLRALDLFWIFGLMVPATLEGARVAATRRE